MCSHLLLFLSSILTSLRAPVKQKKVSRASFISFHSFTSNLHVLKVPTVRMMHSLTPMFVLFVLIPSLALAYPRVVQPITVKRLPHRGRSNNFVLEARGKNIATHFETGQCVGILSISSRIWQVHPKFRGACGGFNVDSDFIVALNSGVRQMETSCLLMLNKSLAIW